MKSEKLVRDYIPAIIEESGNTCTSRSVESVDEHYRLLKLKAIEEIDEFIENPSYEEAADMVEVIKTFCHLNGLEWDAVLGAAVHKQETHGSFGFGTILQHVIYERNE
jgi:predicted house-cleaning noncanonical NTP pyrophosphatase (MazG superfamily)